MKYEFLKEKYDENCFQQKSRKHRFVTMMVCNYIVLSHFAVNGDWGEWKEWSSCFGGCKNGRQRRRRTCDSPAPANNGRDCSGTGSQIRRCKPLRCPSKYQQLYRIWSVVFKKVVIL